MQESQSDGRISDGLIGRIGDPERVGSCILALGSIDFPDRFVGLLNKIAEADLYSAYRLDGAGQVTFLSAGGVHPSLPDFSRHVSLSYAKDYWRADPSLREIIANTQRPGRSSGLCRQSRDAIPDGRYRRNCYEHPRVLDRISLLNDAHGLFLLLNVYRLQHHGYFSAADQDRLFGQIPLLSALLTRHAIGEVRSTITPDLAARMFATRANLSPREAEVAAGIVCGQGAKEIARAMALGASSVITYKRRAYQKLGVTSRSELASCFGRLSCSTPVGRA